jgi:tripartite-type tricarboxylate transporter receptor subunit TctC
MNLLARSVLFSAAAIISGASHAQAWPSKPIKVFVGYPVGTSPDLSARISTAEMAKRLGTSFVIENRPGASGMLAPLASKAADPDGYNFVFSGLVNAHPSILKTNPMILGKDMLPVGDITAAPWVALARASLGVKTWGELVAYSKANPGKVNYGSVASTIDLFMEMMKRQTGITYTPIRYKGAPVPELLNGEIDFYVGTITGLMPQVQAGKINVILVTVKPEVLANYPVQTAAEIGLKGFEIISRFGMIAPPGTPRDIIQKMTEALGAASKSPDVIEPVRKLGIEVKFHNAEEQLKDHEAQTAFFAEAARLTGFQPQ